jgi:predicted HAD superfamily phosphohydrolase
MKNDQYAAFLKQDQLLYEQIFLEAQNRYNSNFQEFVVLACSEAGISHSNFNLTELQLQKDKEAEDKRREVLMKVQQVRLLLEKEHNPVTMTEQQAIDAFKFKVAESLKVDRKVKTIQMTVGGEKGLLLVSLEQLKISNRLQHKFGFDSDDLERALQHYGLLENKELESFVRLAEA